MKLEQQIEAYEAEKESLLKEIGKVKANWWLLKYFVPATSIGTTGIIAIDNFSNGNVGEGLLYLTGGFSVAALGIFCGKTLFYLRDVLQQEFYQLDHLSLEDYTARNNERKDKLSFK